MLGILKNTLQKLYQQYELVTCIYMFEPWEKKLINGFVALTLSLLLFSGFFYLPTYIETFLEFITPLPRESNTGTPAFSPPIITQKISVS